LPVTSNLPEKSPMTSPVRFPNFIPNVPPQSEKLIVPPEKSPEKMEIDPKIEKTSADLAPALEPESIEEHARSKEIIQRRRFFRRVRLFTKFDPDFCTTSFVSV